MKQTAIFLYNAAMRNVIFNFFGLLFFCCFIIFSCKKIELKPATELSEQANLPKNTARLLASGGGGFQSADFIPQDGDSIERETVLGVQLTNPYLIPNMEQAYINLGYNPGRATISCKHSHNNPETPKKLHI